MSKLIHTKSKFNTIQTELVETLNYSNLICKVRPEDYDQLKYWLEFDNCNKLWRLEYVKQNNYFYIENCDLQDLSIYCCKPINDIDDILNHYIKEGYYVCDIVFYENGFMLKEIVDS